MHLRSQDSLTSRSIEFLWLELTNRCNLKCTHCYADSGPHVQDDNPLSTDEYRALLRDAFELGCRQVQFIGGEPTLRRDLPLLLEEAHGVGFELIEVFTNLVKLSDEMLAAFVKFDVSVATSFYAADAERHDRITLRPHSYASTIANIRRVLEHALPLRIGVIDVDRDEPQVDRATAFLKSLGVTNIGTDRLRSFGRAERAEGPSMRELCGQCAGRTLAVGPDGVVAPCIMSKHWAVGSLHKRSLFDLATSPDLAAVRADIGKATAATENCYPQCAPNNQGCGPNCSPNASCSPCGPNGGWKCQPNSWCNPAQQRHLQSPLTAE